MVVLMQENSHIGALKDNTLIATKGQDQQPWLSLFNHTNNWCQQTIWYSRCLCPDRCWISQDIRKITRKI